MTRERLAEECRKLASECSDGIAPRLIADQLTDYAGHYCVAGLLGHRVFGDVRGVRDAIANAYPRARKAYDALVAANNSASDKDRHRTLVSPLRALARALEGHP